MNLKTLFIHFFSIIILVATIYLPIKLLHIQEQKLFQVIHTTKLQEDNLIQLPTIDIIEKLTLLCCAEQADSNIIIVNRKLQSMNHNTNNPRQSIVPILLKSLNKLYQSNVISALEFKEEPSLLEVTLSTLTNQLDNKSVSFYSITADCYPYKISAIIDANSYLIYELDIVAEQPLFTDEDNLVNTWEDYLEIQLKPLSLVKTNSIEPYYNKPRIIDYADTILYTDTILLISLQQIVDTNIFYTFYYTNSKNKLSIQLDYEQYKSLEK